MNSTVTVVDQLEEIAGGCFNVGDRLTEAAGILKRTESPRTESLVAELADCGKSLHDLSAKLLEMETSLSASFDSESIPPVAPATPKSSEMISLRPVRRGEEVPAASAAASLGKKWQETEARLTGLSQLVENALRSGSADEAARSLANLALRYHREGKFDEAEKLHLHALAFREKFFGPDHWQVATSLNNIAILRRDQGRYPEAATLFNRSLEISEKAWGPNHPRVARRLSNLAGLYLLQGKPGNAEPLFQRVLAISRQHSGPAHREIVSGLKDYAEFLRKAEREDEAAVIETRVQSLQTDPARPK
ncbi:MAG: hypothetical protein A3J28_16330 [Acidobacteria bacterium RIFCSPLOWO2_12_FULL_60_22]|nr:MAG: hypothetical protein A3J28_16330 [Acidobacteria bacterium RIFCSPLOWO2_12_FULL_60_22]